MASSEMTEEFKTKFVDGEFVVCTCPNGTMLMAKPLPGDMTKCPCGKGYDKAKVARLELHKEFEENEKKATEEKEKKNNSDPFKDDKPPVGIALAVYKTFKNVVLPAFQDPAGKAVWDVAVLGETVLDAMTTLNEYYTDLTNTNDKAKLLDAFRKESTNVGIITKLADKIKQLATA